MGHDTVEGFGQGDALELPEDLLETGMKASDLSMTTGRLDRRKALRVSFELDGRQHSTTFLGNRRQIKAARDSVLQMQSAGASYSADNTLTTSTGSTLQLDESLQIDAFYSNDTIVATVAFSSSAPNAVKFQLTDTSGIKASYGYSLSGQKSEVSFEGNSLLEQTKSVLFLSIE